ncbi:nucleotide exchange factor GrpE [Cohnella candidum]|uniref:Protein GrpE n=1 Tax=Cohnella candidum TaxID=2674991 RepID=A0A3G3JU24_9BACL|nr:nucleotide exchange factor GrpE [Cohnella candidum]AYQ71725.1 nucleotide exchange factor GrpE [Cohnella candidum]
MHKKETKEQERMAEDQEERVETTPAGSEEPAAEEWVPEDNGGDSSAEGQGDPRIAELAKQAEDNHNRYLRVQADFDNFRRRTQKEKEDLAQYASMKLVGQLLPVLDNFERALQAGGESAGTDSFAKGIDMIYRQFSQVMEAEGLRKMDVVGQPFDPELHQAIMQVESEEHEEGTVVEAVQNGYWLKDKVLRPAMVKVSG